MVEARMKRSSVAAVFDLQVLKMNRKASKNTVLIKPIVTNAIDCRHRVCRLFVKCLINEMKLLWALRLLL